MVDIDLDEEELIVIEGQETAARRGSCLFDVREGKDKLAARPPLTPSQRASSFFGKFCTLGRPERVLAPHGRVLLALTLGG